MSTVTLSLRDRALLAAVEAGRCDIVQTGVPDLRVDGLWFCDQSRARALLTAGLVVGAAGGSDQAAVPALLTDAGRELLDVDRHHLAQDAEVEPDGRDDHPAVERVRGFVVGQVIPRTGVHLMLPKPARRLNLASAFEVKP